MLKENKQRRKLIQATGIGSLWVSPVIASVVLPVHAMTTEPDPAAVGPEAGQQTFTFSSTFMVPAGITRVEVVAQGGAGGLGHAVRAPGQTTATPHALGGLGGEATGTLNVTEGQELVIIIGYGGGDAAVSRPGRGGEPDGGMGGRTGIPISDGATGGGGGGASRVSLSGNDLVIAGGGGGGGGGFVLQAATGGAGGNGDGSNGLDGIGTSLAGPGGDGGGSSTAEGENGAGGNSSGSRQYGAGGGGGGGVLGGEGGDRRLGSGFFILGGGGGGGGTSLAGPSGSISTHANFHGSVRLIWS